MEHGRTLDPHASSPLGWQGASLAGPARSAQRDPLDPSRGLSIVVRVWLSRGKGAPSSARPPRIRSPREYLRSVVVHHRGTDGGPVLWYKSKTIRMFIFAASSGRYPLLGSYRPIHLRLCDGKAPPPQATHKEEDTVTQPRVKAIPEGMHTITPTSSSGMPHAPPSGTRYQQADLSRGARK